MENPVEFNYNKALESIGVAAANAANNKSCPCRYT